MILNSANPASDKSIALAYELEVKYKVPVALVSCLDPLMQKTSAISLSWCSMSSR